MMALADTIEIARRREQAQKWDQGEADILAKIELPPPPELDDETRKDLQPFLAWTTNANVRYCPCKPHVVAAFVLHQSATGSTEQLLRSVDAIAALHNKYNLANPCATTAARTALESVTGFEPPRSWKGPEKEMFTTLPAEVRAAVARREKDREKELRRCQNELAAMKRQSTAADIKEPSKVKEETNG